MGRLINVVGNSGVGKTTFVQNLCRAEKFSQGLEQHLERPYQRLFAEDKHRYAFRNQVDYLLLRVEQELEILEGTLIGVQDGGLDQDYFIFTKFFYQKGYLDGEEYKICERLYKSWRQLLPGPDIIIWLQAPVQLIADRYQDRGRELEITEVKDLWTMDKLLADWLDELSSDKLLTVDVAEEDRSYAQSINRLMRDLEQAGW